MEHDSRALFEVKQALEQHISYWNKGKLEEALFSYWNDPEIVWINKHGIQKGFASAKEDFRKAFPNPESMGNYIYDILHIEALTDQTVYIVYKWTIEVNRSPTMSAVSSQIWKKISDKWTITSEHVS